MVIQQGQGAYHFKWPELVDWKRSWEIERAYFSPGAGDRQADPPFLRPAQRGSGSRGTMFEHVGKRGGLSVRLLGDHREAAVRLQYHCCDLLQRGRA